MKPKPLGRVAGRQLASEIPEDRAPDEVIVDSDNRLRRVPVGNIPKVQTLALWARAAKLIEISLTDSTKDGEFMEGMSLGLQLFAMRLGGDPMTPPTVRPPRAEKLQVVTREVLDNRDLLQSEAPTALHNINLIGLHEEDVRLGTIKAARGEVRILDRSLDAVQGQIENRISPTLDLIYNRGRSVIDSHVVLQERMPGLHDFCVGAAEDAADTRKERDQQFELGVEAGRKAQAAESQKAAAPAAIPPVPAPAPAAAPPPALKIKRTSKKR